MNITTDNAQTLRNALEKIARYEEAIKFYEEHIAACPAGFTALAKAAKFQELIKKARFDQKDQHVHQSL